MGWWTRRGSPSSSPAIAATAVFEPDTVEEAARRQLTTVLGYAKLIRAVEHDPRCPPGGMDKGLVYVCGVGQLPVQLLLAVADLEDAREKQRANPHDPDVSALVAAAEEAVRRAGRSAGG